jgi:hypothetical protein
LVIFFYVAVVAPFISAILSGMRGHRETDAVMQALSKIDSTITFMGCWVIAAIISTRIDRYPK